MYDTRRQYGWLQIAALGVAWSASAVSFGQGQSSILPDAPAIGVDVDAGCGKGVVLIGASPSVSISLSNPRAAAAYQKYLEADHAARDAAARAGERYSGEPFSVSDGDTIRLPVASGRWASHLHLSLVTANGGDDESHDTVWIPAAAFESSIGSAAAEYPVETEVRSTPVFIVAHLDPAVMQNAGDGEYVFRVEYDTHDVPANECWSGTISGRSESFTIRKAQNDQDTACLEENLSVYYLSLGKFADAEKHARRVVEIAPSRNGWVAYCYLGDALEAQNRMPEAVAAWKVFVDKYPPDTESRTVMKLRERVKAFETEQAKLAGEKPK